MPPSDSTRGVNEVVVFGASGYSGLELLRILAWHPKVEVVAASSDRWAGQAVADAIAGWPGELRFEPHETVKGAVQAGQIALLATPARTSADLAPGLLAAGVRVVDLSGAFRLKEPALYQQWYGFEHPCPGLLDEARYGLPELLPVPPDAALVANPGCYATAAIMVLAPLLKAGALDRQAPIVVDGKSGATGAGRSAKEDLLYAEVGENLRAYRVARHQHTPEIESALGRVSGHEVRINFTAHLVPMRRGILASVYGAIAPGHDETRIAEAYGHAYGPHSFVRLVDRPPETAAVRNSNLVDIGWTLDERTGVLCAFGAIDNLVKGAAGQAVQNMNQLLMLPTECGLVADREASR